MSIDNYFVIFPRLISRIKTNLGFVIFVLFLSISHFIFLNKLHNSNYLKTQSMKYSLGTLSKADSIRRFTVIHSKRKKESHNFTYNMISLEERVFFLHM